MLTPVRRLVLVATLAIGVAVAAPHAQSGQPPPTEQELVTREFALSQTDEQRAAIAAKHPWLKEASGLRDVMRLAATLTTDRMTTEAERAYQGAFWIADANDNDGDRANTLLGLGQVAGQLRGNLAKSLELSQRALRFAERADNFDYIQRALANIGIVHRRFGDFEKASTYFAQALALAESLKKTASVGRVYNNIGTMHFYQGNLALAREYFDRSLVAKRKDPGAESADYANTVANLGILDLEIGNTRSALDYLQQSVAIYEKSGNVPRSVLSLLNFGRAQISAGWLDDAESTLKRAMKLAEDAKEDTAIAHILFLQGMISRDRGELMEAIALQQRSLATRIEKNEAAAVAESHVELSQLWLRRERPVDAESAARAAIAIAEPGHLLSPLAGAQFHLARALEAQERREAALSMYEAAIETVEKIRERALGEDQSRQAFMRERLGPYTGLASLHARSGRIWEALQTIEQARARSLLDILSYGRPPTTILSEALRQRERDVINALAIATQEMKAAERDRRVAPEEKAAIGARLEHARLSFEGFKAEVYAAHPRLRLTRGDAPVITRSELDTLVPEGTAAVEFVVDPDHVWVYLTLGNAQGAAVSAQRLTMPPATVLALADRFSRQVSTRDLGFSATSKDLYTMLLGHLDGQLSGVSRLIVVPDVSLWAVPFQALTTPRGQFLVEERSVSYAPSLSALFALRERSGARPVRAGRLIALGDPAERGPGSSQLPEALREVQALGKLYGADRSTLLVGTAATEAALRAAAADASVLHIAAHGVLDDHGPMFSHLRLAPNRGDDGKLEAWELADLELSADIVVLSACETARGAFGGGEGVIGLSWALLAAGASSAVVSQWEVDSASTTGVMIAFHERLLKEPRGFSAAPDALRAASLRLLKDPRYRHPFYWAGFIVMGS